MSVDSRSARIAVTGATGHIGGLVAQSLADAGVPQRLIARSVNRLPQLAGADSAETCNLSLPAQADGARQRRAWHPNRLCTSGVSSRPVIGRAPAPCSNRSSHS